MRKRGDGEQESQPEEGVPGDDVDCIEGRWPLPTEDFGIAREGRRVDVSRHRELDEVNDGGERRSGQHPSERHSREGFRLFRGGLMDSEHQADHDRRYHKDEDLTDGEVRIGQRIARVADGRESCNEHGDVDKFDHEDRAR